jgi:hypothetical protein
VWGARRPPKRSFHRLPYLQPMADEASEDGARNRACHDRCVAFRRPGHARVVSRIQAGFIHKIDTRVFLLGAVLKVWIDLWFSIVPPLRLIAARRAAAAAAA